MGHDDGAGVTGASRSHGKADKGASQISRAQQVIDTLALRCLPVKSEPAAKCALESNPRAQGGACCRDHELEIDREIRRLVEAGVFKQDGVCPHRVVASHLVAALSMGPEVFRAHRSEKLRVDPVVEIKGALRRIADIRASGPRPEQVACMVTTGNDGCWEARQEILFAERHLKKALDFFKAQPRVKTSSSPRGRSGDLRTQAVARAMAGAWRELTGSFPAKDNCTFQRLLLAAMTTIFGHPEPEPNLEWATALAVKRIQRRAAPAGANRH